MDAKLNYCKTQNWYADLGRYSLPTYFLPLDAKTQELIAQGKTSRRDPEVAIAIDNLRSVMKLISGNSFVSVDDCSPTDTFRFETKRGAVYSAESAWAILAQSQKIKERIAAGEVSTLVLRPFRRMSRTREFRLFIKDGELVGASQYNLTRFFHRLDRNRSRYWKILQKFFRKAAKRMPEKLSLTMDVYITSDDKVILLDLNSWGEPTSPLLFLDWNSDWSAKPRLITMLPPTKISGNVRVSF